MTSYGHSFLLEFSLTFLMCLTYVCVQCTCMCCVLFVNLPTVVNTKMPTNDISLNELSIQTQANRFYAD